MDLAALPMPLTWAGSPAKADDDGRSRLGITAGARTDMFHDPDGSSQVTNAPRAAGAPPAGDFQLSARVTVSSPRPTTPVPC